MGSPFHKAPKPRYNGHPMLSGQVLRDLADMVDRGEAVVSNVNKTMSSSGLSGNSYDVEWDIRLIERVK